MALFLHDFFKHTAGMFLFSLYSHQAYLYLTGTVAYTPPYVAAVQAVRERVSVQHAAGLPQHRVAPRPTPHREDAQDDLQQEPQQQRGCQERTALDGEGVR